MLKSDRECSKIKNILLLFDPVCYTRDIVTTYVISIKLDISYEDLRGVLQEVDLSPILFYF